MTSKPRHTLRDFTIVAALAVGLTYIFWWPLWQGGGLIGGDLYPYYFPQKVWLADSLQQGTIPLWNALVGFGYPVLGESQTGALYPPNLLLYSTLSVNTAYVVSQLGHYVLAFLAMWAFARRLGLNQGPACFAALAFVYGWFPARICLEWAIIGGAWFAVIMWSATWFIQSRSRWAFIITALALGMDLLAGHYNLAFITLLLVVFLPWLVPRDNTVDTDAVAKWSGMNSTATLLLAVACGFLIASVQLLPTLELKSISQRQDENEAFSATYGHLPPTAATQLVLPWSWYANEQPMDQLLQQVNAGAVPDSTNQVEAQLYVGLATALLAVMGIVFRFGPSCPQLPKARWWLVAIVGLAFATGWPIVWLQDVPGFGFFRGPGRYGMLTACALALLAGNALQSLRQKLANRTWGLLLLMLTMLTIADLWLASRQYQIGQSPFIGRQVFYATIIDDPPVKCRHESQLNEALTQSGQPVRVYAPGPNVPTMIGLSAIPVYLGLGPAIYETNLTRADFSVTDPQQADAILSRLKDLGVSHLLLEQPFNMDIWKVGSGIEVFDPLLNRAFGRREPYYLYGLPNAPGLVQTREPDTAISNMDLQSNRIALDVTCEREDILTVTHLNYPGWIATIDDKAVSVNEEALFREVSLSPGQHHVEFQYRPRSVLYGGILTVCGLVLTITLGLLFLKKRGQAEAISP